MGGRLMWAPAHPVQLVVGLVIWSLWFVLVYGGLSVGCEFAPPATSAGSFTWINALLLALTLATLALLLSAAWRCWRAPAQAGNSHFVARLAAALYLVAAIATLAVGLPILVLPPCV